MKRVLSFLLVLLLTFSLVPAKQSMAASRKKINTIKGTSTINNNTVRYGQSIFTPTFTVTEGSPARLVPDMGGWLKKNDNGTWDTVANGKRFGAGTYVFKCQVRTDDPEYVLGNNAEVFINGVQWTSIGEPTVGDSFSYSYTNSPEYVIPEADPITGTATIGGTIGTPAYVGTSLTVDISNVNVTSPHLLEYQWQKSTDRENWINIDGANNQYYKPNDTMVGMYVRAKITHPFYSSEIYTNSRYVKIRYSITVENGRAKLGSGSVITEAEEGTFISLTANAAPEGMAFDKWIVSGVTVSNVYSANTSFTMPANAVTAKATYKYIIKSVDITIIRPVVGQKPDMKPVLPSGALYEYDPEFGVKWFDETAECYLKTTDTFKSGHVYNLRIDLIPKGNTEFTSDAMGYINGKGVSTELRDGTDYETLCLSYTYAALPGWCKQDGKWKYYENDGKAATGWKKISSIWYYFDASGIMQTGWQKISGKWYYFNASGAMLTGWQKINGKTYYLKSSGAMAANEWCGGWWLNKDGSWTYPYKASWKKNSKGWWYEDTSGWYAKNTTYKIDDKNYTFDAKGYWVK